MKAVIQRVREASVSVGGEVVGKVDRGMLILLCVMKGDGEAHAKSLAEKIAQFRFFEDAKGHMNLSAVQLLDEPLRRELGMTKAPGALVVSQFTLSADGSKGRRPSFDQAAAPDLARALVGGFVDHLAATGLVVEQGRFGMEMQVHLQNDGPVTFVLEALD